MKDLELLGKPESVSNDPCLLLTEDCSAVGQGCSMLRLCHVQLCTSVLREHVRVSAAEYVPRPGT